MSRRPLVISSICILEFICVPVKILLAFVPKIQQFGAWYPSFLVADTAIVFLSMIGLWKQKKWGLVIYFLWEIMVQVIYAVGDIWKPMAIAYPSMIILLVLSQASKMGWSMPSWRNGRLAI